MGPIICIGVSKLVLKIHVTLPLLDPIKFNFMKFSLRKKVAKNRLTPPVWNCLEFLDPVLIF